MYEFAKRVAMLVLDDIGQEASVRDDSVLASERLAATKEVLLHRWNRGATTIVTTDMDDQQLEDLYTSAIQTRLIRDPSTILLELEGGER